MTFLFLVFCVMMFFGMLSWFSFPPMFFRPRPFFGHHRPHHMHHPMRMRGHGRMGGRRF